MKEKSRKIREYSLKILLIEENKQLQGDFQVVASEFEPSMNDDGTSRSLKVTQLEHFGDTFLKIPLYLESDIRRVSEYLH